MIESVFEFVKKDDEKKQIIVKESLFRPDSEEAKIAKLKERKLFHVARKQGYNILCNNRIIYDYLKEKEYRKKELEKRRERLLEIKGEFQKEKGKKTSIRFLKLSIELELIKAYIKDNYLSENKIQEARI